MFIIYKINETLLLHTLNELIEEYTENNKYIKRIVMKSKRG